jgi:hypothetical protein
MGIIVNKNDEQSRLHDRISADLRAKAMESSLQADDPDLVEDSVYTKDLKATNKYTWIIIVLIALAVAAVVMLAIIRS